MLRKLTYACRGSFFFSGTSVSTILFAMARVT